MPTVCLLIVPFPASFSSFPKTIVPFPLWAAVTNYTPPGGPVVVVVVAVCLATTCVIGQACTNAEKARGNATMVYSIHRIYEAIPEEGAMNSCRPA